MIENKPEENEIKVKGYIKKVIYPKNKNKDEPTWAVFTFSVDSVVSGEIDPRYFASIYNVTFSGNVPSLDTSTLYTISARLIDSKYGKQYEVIMMNEEYDFSSVDSQREYLSHIIGPRTINSLFARFKNPMDIIKNGDIKSLIEVPGIKEKTAIRLINKYKKTIDYGEAYVELAKFGISDRMIEKICDQFGSAKTFIDLIKKNPYKLIDYADGVGWKKADDYALKCGILPDSDIRIDAYINYFLKDIAENKGDTWITSSEIVDAIKSLSENITDDIAINIVQKKINNGDLFYKVYSENDKRIGKMYYRNLEEKIADELKRISLNTKTEIFNIDRAIKECQEENGWEYTEEQRNIINNILTDENLTIVTGKAGCVDCDTEFFNGDGWKKISDYNDNDLVLQYRYDGVAELVKPRRYIVSPCDKLYHYTNINGQDMCLSADHNMIYFGMDSDIHVIGFADLVEKYNKNFKSADRVGTYKSIVAFNYSDDFKSRGKLTKKNLNKVLLSILLYFFKDCIDGDYFSRIYDRRNLRFEKVKDVLKNLDIDYEYKRCGAGHMSAHLKFKIPKYAFSCNFEDFLYYHPSDRKKISDFLFQISKRRGKKDLIFEFNNVETKKDADILQMIFCGNGNFTKIIDNNNGTFTIRFYQDKKYLNFAESHLLYKENGTRVADFTRYPCIPEEYTPKDGKQYCFTVDNHMWVARRNNCVFVTGNSGKSSIMYPITKAFTNNGLQVAQVALSGKAALNLTEITGIEGKTIHRLLGVGNGSDEFFYNKTNKLPYDIIIIDELSMVGGQIFLSLLEAIKDGAKLICIGDVGQLEAIGLCNCLNDMIKSGKISHYHLTSIMRQAQDSAIISNAGKIYDGKQIIDNGFFGHDVRGEKQDFEIISALDNKECADIAFEEYKRALAKGYNVSDICMLTSKRVSGESSAVNMNLKIHDLLTVKEPKVDEDGFVEEFVRDYKDQENKYQIKYHVGDRIKVTKNIYDLYSDAGDKINVFNGNVGTILWIDPQADCMCVEFYHGNVVIPKSELGNVQLGYAITTHSAQGSGFPYVIAICDPSAYTLNTKEMLYTQLTRAKKKCVLIGPTNTIRQSVYKTNVNKKRTWLSDLLVEKM